MDVLCVSCASQSLLQPWASPCGAGVGPVFKTGWAHAMGADIVWRMQSVTQTIKRQPWSG